jgi:hypothetical protein
MFSRIRFPRVFAAAVAALALSTALPQQASAQAFSDFAENKIVDALLRGQAIGTPATWYIALYTTACSDTGPGTEVSGNGYARKDITAALASWDGTQGGGVSVASSGTGGLTANNATLTFATPSGAGWGTVTHAGITDALTSGNMWVCIDINPDKTINAGDTVSFAVDALSVTVQ